MFFFYCCERFHVAWKQIFWGSVQVHNLLLSFLLRSPTKNSFEETLFKSLHHYPPLYNSPRRDFDESKNTAFGKRLQRRWYLLLSFDSLRTCTQTFTFRSGWMTLCGYWESLCLTARGYVFFCWRGLLICRWLLLTQPDDFSDLLPCSLPHRPRLLLWLCVLLSFS